MANIKKYNLKGDEIGVVSIGEDLLQEVANSQMIKDYLVAYRANQRQWSANTKSRAEVSHSGQKPHPQKGTGRARQGYLGSPQYKGGGRVFGPKPKFDQHVKLNKKERRAVIRSLLIQKIQEEKMHILSVAGLESPKTKVFADFIRTLGLQGKRVLFLAEDLFAANTSALEDVLLETAAKADAMSSPEEAMAFLSQAEDAAYDKYDKELILADDQRDVVIRSVRNIPKVTFSLLPNVHGYDLALHQDIILLEGSMNQLLEFFEGGNSHDA